MEFLLGLIIGILLTILLLSIIVRKPLEFLKKFIEETHNRIDKTNYKDNI